MDFALNLKKGDSPRGMQSGSWSVVEKRSYEVLGAQDGKVNKLRIRFGDRDARPLLGVKEKLGIVGNTYVLESKGSALKSRRGDKGAEATQPGEREVLGEYAWVGRHPVLMKLIDDGNLASGETRKASPNQALALLGQLPSVEHGKTRVKITSRGVEEGARRLFNGDLEATVVVQSNTTRFALELKGPVTIDLTTGVVASLETQGRDSSRRHPKAQEGRLRRQRQGRCEALAPDRVLERQAQALALRARPDVARHALIGEA